MNKTRFARRDFLKITGAATLALSLDSIGFLGGTAHATEKVFQKWEYKNWEDLHREEWTWDKVTYGTHLVDCYPGNCLWRVYTKDGIVWREQQAAKYPIVDATGPDGNVYSAYIPETGIAPNNLVIWGLDKGMDENALPVVSKLPPQGFTCQDPLIVYWRTRIDGAKLFGQEHHFYSGNIRLYNRRHIEPHKALPGRPLTWLYLNVYP